MDTVSQAIIAAISALVTTVIALIGLVKVYLPKHDERLHNPHLEQLRAIHDQLATNNQKTTDVATLIVTNNQKTSDVATLLTTLSAVNHERHGQIIDCLQRIERNTTK